MMDIRPPVAVPPGPDTQAEPLSYLHSLRERLVEGRVERGPCPRFADLKQDSLPRVQALPGRQSRAHHLELCLVCQTRLRAWRREWAGRLHWGLAATGIAAHYLRVKGGGGMRQFSRILRRTSRRAAPRSRPQPVRSERRPVARGVRKTAGIRLRPRTRGVTESRHPARRREGRGKEVDTLPPLVVLEKGPGQPEALRLADVVAARGGALVVVDAIEEIFTDRDFPSVHTIVLGRPRSFGELPMVYETIRKQAPGRALFAVVPIPPNGSIAHDLEEDHFVIPSPLSLESWVSALDFAGWTSAS